jgi:hypothetical protein
LNLSWSLGKDDGNEMEPELFGNVVNAEDIVYEVGPEADIPVSPIEFVGCPTLPVAFGIVLHPYMKTFFFLECP